MQPEISPDQKMREQALPVLQFEKSYILSVLTLLIF
jgi:hypothetical protein